MELTVQLSGRASTRDDRFDALRRLVAKELHPDFCAGEAVEKTLRADLRRSARRLSGWQSGGSEQRWPDPISNSSATAIDTLPLTFARCGGNGFGARFH